jgi:outer membrane receptor protein involved in Fe transport
MKMKLFLLLCALLGAALAAHAQTSRGTVSGTVTDPNNAMIAGASVTLTNTQTTVTRTTTTNNEGFYRFDAVDLGNYTVTTNATGFGTVTKTDVIVNANQTATVDTQLQPGGQQVTIDVVAEAGAALQTEAPVRGGNITQRQITELPIAGLNPAALALTLPGVSTNRTGVGVSTFVVNGARGRSNNFLIDGVENNDISVAGQALQIINPDAVQEVSIQTSNYDSEFGRAGGAVINTITRSGTNSFHGTLWTLIDSTRDDAITSSQARDPNIIARGYPPFGIQTIYSATLGGPLYLPRFGEGGKSIINGKDRTFFFVAYEFNRARANSQTTLTTPTAAGRATLQSVFGGTSANVNLLLNATQNTIGTANPQLIALGVAPGAAGTSSTTCPAPAGNRPCVEFGSFVKNFATIFDERQFQLRIDHKISDHDQLAGRFLADPQSQPFGGTGTGFPGFEADFTATLYNFLLSETHVFSPSLTNEMRVAYNRIGFTFPLHDPSVSGTLPQILFNGSTANITGTPTGLGTSATFPQGRIANNYVIQDTVTKIIGNHTFRGGIDFLRQIARQIAPFNPRGTLIYGSSTGYTPFANFVDNFGGSGGSATRDFGSGIYTPSLYRTALFIQDRWKASEALTLTIGVRYENFGTPFNTLRTPAYTGLFNVDPVTLAGPYSQPDKVASDNNNFAPSVGFAYSPNFTHGLLARFFGAHKSVVRGGYQIGYDSFFNNIASNAAASSPNLVSTQVPSTTAAGPRGLNNFTTQFPTVARPLSPFDTQTLIAPNLVNPYYQRWSLGIQRELPLKLIVEASYVGSKGTKLFINEDANPLVLIPALRHPVPAGFTGTPQTRLDPLQGSRTVRTNGGSSSYNSGQLLIQRRFANNFTLTGSYTYSKLMSNNDEVFAVGVASSVSSFFAIPAVFGGDRNDRSVSLNDRTHRASITYVYALPFMKAQHGFVGHVLGGWQLSGVTSFESGVPYSVLNGFDSDGLGGSGSDRPTFNPLGRRGVRAIPVVNASGVITGYVNPDAGNAPIDPLTAEFIVNPTFSPTLAGSVPRTGNLGRNTERSPGINNWDLTIQKSTHLSETVRVEVRAEFFNVFNHPQFLTGSVSPFSPTGGFVPTNAATTPAGRFLNPDTVGTDGGGRVVRYQLRLRF